MVDFSQWPMVDFLQRFKPREYAQHTSLPFQGKGWGMGSKKAWAEGDRAHLSGRAYSFAIGIPSGHETACAAASSARVEGRRSKAEIGSGPR